MRLVVDANVLFSAFIKQGLTARLLVRPDFQLFAPEFLLDEFLKNRAVILAKTHRTKEQFAEILLAVQELVVFVPIEEFKEFMEAAESASPDIDDVQYFALALKLACPLWSNDKNLKKQNTLPIYSTEDLLRLF